MSAFEKTIIETEESMEARNAGIGLEAARKLSRVDGPEKLSLAFFNLPSAKQ